MNSTTYPSKQEVLLFNTRAVYRQLACLLNFRWPSPMGPLCPANMVHWSKMTPEQRQFWVASYDQMQVAITDLTRKQRRAA